MFAITTHQVASGLVSNTTGNQTIVEGALKDLYCKSCLLETELGITIAYYGCYKYSCLVGVRQLYNILYI